LFGDHHPIQHLLGFEAFRRAIGNHMTMTMVFKAVRLGAGFCLLEKLVIDLNDIHSRLSKL